MVTILDIILIAYGAYTLFGLLFKPDFYWNGKLLTRAREAMGDTLAQVVYLIIAFACLALGFINITAP